MKNRFRGFTILEMLVATAVLALMLVAVLEITGKTTVISRLAGSRMNAEQSVRSALDMMERDLRGVVLTPRATLLVQTKGGSPQLAFLTRGRGPSGTPSRFLAVCYQWDSTGNLFRGYSAVDETVTNLLAAAEAASASGDQPAIASNILQMTVIAILEDGTRHTLTPPAAGTWNASGTVLYGEWSVPNLWTALVPPLAALPTSGPRVKALLVALVGTDGKNFAVLSPGQRALFTQPTGFDPVAEWENVVETASLPPSVRSSVSIQSKVISLR